ncbi:MAG: hypothetical protein KC503_06360 [Myxococcales bacterium]|nr:hypothetical protein [Myxococcales bacterium]
MLTSRRRIARSPLESDSARKRAQSVWQQAGGYLVKSDGPRDFPTRTLAHRGVQVELSLRPNSSHRTARWQTCVRALYPYPVGPRFVVAAAHPDASLPETLFTSAAPGALVAGSPDGDVDDGERPFCAEISAVDDTLRLLSPVFGALRDLWPRALRIEGDRQGVQIGVAGYLDNAEALSRCLDAAAAMGDGERLMGLAALRALGGEYHDELVSGFGPRVRISCKGLPGLGASRELSVDLGRRTRPKVEPWLSTIGRTSWLGEPLYLRAAIVAGRITTPAPELALERYPQLLAALGDRCELRLDRTRLQLAWPRVVDDVEAMRAGAELLARLAAASVSGARGVYR